MALDHTTVLHMQLLPILNIKRGAWERRRDGGNRRWGGVELGDDDDRHREKEREHFQPFYRQICYWRSPISVSFNAFIQCPLNIQGTNFFWTQRKKIHPINDHPLWTNEHHEVHHTLSWMTRSSGLNFIDFIFLDS